MSSVTHSRSVLLSCLVASAAPAPATTTSADFSLQQCRRPFRREARSPQVRTHTFIAQPPHLRRPSLGHKSFVVSCPLPLLGNAFYAVLVHRLTIYAPHFLPTLGRPYAVVLHFAHCDQLAAGLSPAGVRPCWAHIRKAPKEPFACEPWLTTSWPQAWLSWQALWLQSLERARLLQQPVQPPFSGRCVGHVMQQFPH